MVNDFESLSSRINKTFYKQNRGISNIAKLLFEAILLMIQSAISFTERKQILVIDH